MSIVEYLEQKIWSILFYSTFLIILTTMMLFLDVDITFLLLCNGLLVLLYSLYLGITYITQKKKQLELIELVDQLEEKYLISEIIKKPTKLENIGYYYALKKACKSMNDKLSTVEHKYNEYEEYIESFVHEIKTPLAALSLYGDNNNDKEMKKELQKMNNLVEQVLFFARSENTEKDYFVKKMSLEEIIHSVILEYKEYLLTQKISLHIHNLNIEIATDEKWLSFILSQIIQNSIKYSDITKEKKILEIYVKENKNKVDLIIYDNGIGIKEEDLSRIFEKGFTGTDRKKEYSTGIGLYLCKKLCDRLNLGIKITSKEQQFTKVILELPNSSLHNFKENS